MSTPWSITTLSNGIRVVTTPLPTSQSASVNLFIGAGSRAEDKHHSGLFHYLEHMLFKGTESRPDAIQIAETIEGVGGVLNAYTGKEQTCYWNRVPFDQLDVAMEVLADMLRHSILSPAEIDRERSVVQQEIRRGYDQPSQWTGELLMRAAFGDQPVGRAITGTIESVENIGRDDFVAHMDRWYVPERIVLSVAGNVEHDHVVELAERLLGGVPTHQASEFEPAQTELPKQQVQVEHRDIAQCNLALAWHGFPRSDPDRYALGVLNTVLGRGMSSRLFREVRERRGLAYSVGSGTSHYIDTGLMSVSAGVSPENVVEATRVILGECARMVDEPVMEDELRKARDYAIGNFRLGLETSMSLGQRAGEALLLDGEIETVDEVVRKIAAVTPADIERVAGRVFRGRGIALAAVGKVDEDELAGALTAA